MSAKRSVVGRVLRYATLVVILSLMVRGFFLESFVVTTGSMAPLLPGVHRKCNCPKCGFPIVVGTPPADVDPVLHWRVKCPNCGQGDLGLENQPDLPGKWLLVDKNVYEWRSPRRWELIVFRGPSGDPYLKRVVGLPGESVQIKNGNVYIDGEIAQKALADSNQKPPSMNRVTDYSVYNGAKVSRIDNIDGFNPYGDSHYQSVGRHGIKTPYRLGEDEYFVLGDNSAVSDDSRMWTEPGVKRSAIIGRPIR